MSIDKQQQGNRGFNDMNKQKTSSNVNSSKSSTDNLGRTSSPASTIYGESPVKKANTNMNNVNKH